MLPGAKKLLLILQLFKVLYYQYFARLFVIFVALVLIGPHHHKFTSDSTYSTYNSMKESRKGYQWQEGGRLTMKTESVPTYSHIQCHLIRQH
mmetsp:Transcript_12778/g.18627  ORF Transcript_12778/g.18627 Transcript_12778/m.18627 type:complete len:92 (-) Transcript_12778:162-437(-)